MFRNHCPKSQSTLMTQMEQIVADQSVETMFNLCYLGAQSTRFEDVSLSMLSVILSPIEIFGLRVRVPFGETDSRVTLSGVFNRLRYTNEHSHHDQNRPNNAIWCFGYCFAKLSSSPSCPACHHHHYNKKRMDDQLTKKISCMVV